MKFKLGRHELGVDLDSAACWTDSFIRTFTAEDDFAKCRVLSVGPVDFWLTTYTANEDQGTAEHG